MYMQYIFYSCAEKVITLTKMYCFLGQIMKKSRSGWVFRGKTGHDVVRLCKMCHRHQIGHTGWQCISRRMHEGCRGVLEMLSVTDGIWGAWGWEEGLEKMPRCAWECTRGVRQVKWHMGVAWVGYLPSRYPTDIHNTWPRQHLWHTQAYTFQAIWHLKLDASFHTQQQTLPTGFGLVASYCLPTNFLPATSRLQQKTSWLHFTIVVNAEKVDS